MKTLVSTIPVVFLIVSCGGNSKSLTSPSSSPPVNPTVCNFSFSPARVETSSNPQRVTVQVITSSSCSWTATSSDQWITIIRSGPLYHTGNGLLTSDIAGNLGRCPTPARTGRITVVDEAKKAEAKLEVFQSAPSSFQPPAACAVTPISYGALVRGSLTGGDCAVASLACYLEGGSLSTGPKVKYYSFQGFAGQEINISMIAGGLISGGVPSPLLMLLGPTGGLVEGSGGRPGDTTPVISTRLSCPGTYTIEVTSAECDGRGSYSLRLDSRN